MAGPEAPWQGGLGSPARVRVLSWPRRLFGPRRRPSRLRTLRGRARGIVDRSSPRASRRGARLPGGRVARRVIARGGNARVVARQLEAHLRYPDRRASAGPRRRPRGITIRMARPPLSGPQGALDRGQLVGADAVACSATGGVAGAQRRAARRPFTGRGTTLAHPNRRSGLLAGGGE
jgi:hypothetical protein